MRLVFGYGPSITKKLEEFEGKTFDFEDWKHAAELHEAFRSDPKRDMALALSGPDSTTMAETSHDILTAREIGIPVSIHVAFREGTMTGGVKRVADEGLLGPDLQFVHCCATSAEEFKMMADAGATGSWSPQVEISAGLGIPPTRRAGEEGIPPVFACDSVMAASGDLFDEARAGLFAERLMRARDRYAQYRPTVRADELGLSAKQALEAITINAARSIWADDRVGSLTPGKRADVILLRGSDLNLAPMNDAYETIVSSAHASNVDTVIIDGEVVKRDGELLAYDREEVAAELRESAERVFGRADYQGKVPA
jgi:cytosine/adenosine deaminase-related metal-dependent hydrolase